MLVVAVVIFIMNIVLDPPGITQEETGKSEEKAGDRVLVNTSMKESEKEEIQRE